MTPPPDGHAGGIVARCLAAARGGNAARPVAVVAASRLERGREPAARAIAMAVAGQVDDAMALLLDALETDDRCLALRQAAWRILLDARSGGAARTWLRRRIVARETIVRAAAFHLAATVRAGEPLDAPIVSTVVWTAAIQWLCDDLGPEALLPLARPLAERFPEAGFLGELVAMLASIPAAHPLDHFEDDGDAAIQFVPAVATTADTLLVCMSGDEGRFGVPHAYFHRWVSGLPAHVLYLRDLGGGRYRHGLSVIEGGHEGLVATIRTLATGLGVRRMAVIGNSNGGFEAARVGVASGAGRIALFSPRGTRPGGRLDGSNSATARQQALLSTVSDLRSQLDAVPSPPEILCIHGAGNAIDRDVALALATLREVRVLPVPDFRRHNTILASIYRGRLAALLRWTVSLERTPPAF